MTQEEQPPVRQATAPGEAVGAVIQARMGSSRLPGKVLADLNGRPVLQWVVERASRAALDTVVVATTTDPKDDPVAALGRSLGVGVHRGDEADVLGRFVGAAAAFQIDIVVRLTADCPFVDPELLDGLLRKYRDEDLDYCRIDTDTYPRGVDAEVFSRRLLDEADRRAELADEREHVTLFLRRRPGEYRLGDLSAQVRRPFRVTVDTPEDLELVRTVAAHARDLSYRGVSAYLDEHPEVVALNESVRQNPVSLGHPYRAVEHADDGTTMIDCEVCGRWHAFPVAERA